MIKIGYLPLYIKLYDDSGLVDRGLLEPYMNHLISLFRERGFEVVLPDNPCGSPVCRIKSEFDAAAEKFNREGVAAVVTQHLAYSPSLESIGALLSLEAPIVILDTTVDYELVSRAGKEELTLPNHGIHGVQDMCAMLRRHGRNFSLCVGHADHSDVIGEAADCCRAAAVKRAVAASRVGSVGGSFEGMGDFEVNPDELRRTLGPEVVFMNREEGESYTAGVAEADVEREIAWDRAHFTWEIENLADYRASVRAGLAVRAWMRDRSLSACTINFLSLDRCGLKKMPFTEACKMLMRGEGYAGEGDVLTAALVGGLRTVHAETNFVEMFSPDWKENVILLSHMGETNLNLVQWKPVLRSVAFPYNSCGGTAAAFGCMRSGKAVFVNLAPAREGWLLTAAPVQMLGIGLEHGAYRYSMQGWMRPEVPVAEFLRRFSEGGGTHHSALVYGADVREFAELGRMLGARVNVIA